MKHIFIVNPTSGSGQSTSMIPVIENYFKDSSGYEILLTKHVGHATELASHYSIRDNVCLYAVGGDGTAYEVLNGIKDGVMMAVIPSGTGNDYYRSISNNQKNYDVKKVLLDTIEGKVVKVDYGIANEHRFLNSCCIGLDAEVTEYVNEVVKKKKYIPNSMAYAVAAIAKVIKPKKLKCTFITKDEVFEKTIVLTAIMNGKYYGGDLPRHLMQICKMNILI